MALDGHVQPPLLVAGQPCQVALGHAYLGQHLLGQGQQSLAGPGELHRTGLAHEQRAAQTLLQVLDLVGEGRLGQVDPFGRLHQGAGVAQGDQGAEVSQLEHG